MTPGPQTFSKMLKVLRETSNAKEKREALTYIRSNSKKMESANAIKEEQYKELCRLVIDTFSNGDDNTQLEAYETLSTIIKDFKDHALNLFDAMILANKKSRLRLIKLLEVLDDNVILTLTWDSVAVDFFKDCLCNVQPKNMDWLSSTSCVDNSQPLIDAENKALTADQKLEEETITHVMSLLRRLYKLTVMTSDLNIGKFDILLLEKVALLAYMGHKRQRDPALKLLQQALLTDIASNIRLNYSDAWARYKTTLQSTYCKRMLLLVGACEVDWATQWNISIQLLGTDLHRGAGLINNLLSVEEKAFKSTEAIIRRQAFLSWKLLVDNFALDPQELATARRIKLLCIPLNAKNSKTELIALTKLEVWWHVIIKLYKDIKPFSHPIITQFLNFCFGPLGDTPLLSSKFNVLASPGKRFYKTKVVALDALCQLLVAKLENHSVFSPILEERLPHAMTDAVFQECYKTVIHSVGEALLILSQLTDNEMKSRYQLAKVFWKSLVNYVQETESEEKDSVYKNLILVVTELINFAFDKPMIKELFLDTVLSDLSNFTDVIAFEDETIPTLATQIFKTTLLMGAGKKEYEALERIIRCSIKPHTGTTYRSNSLKRLRNLLGSLDLSTNDQYRGAVELEMWKVLTNVLIKYMDDSGHINEGNAAKHDFTTIELFLMFPFNHTVVQNMAQVHEIAKVWKKLYGQFELYSDMLATVAPNEILSKTALGMEKSLAANKERTSLIANCLEALLSYINYKAFLSVDGIPTILRLLLGLAINSFSSKSNHDSDVVLKALSAFLITVFGHDAERVVQYLHICEPVVELALKMDSTALSKEISNLWETVVSIFKGLGKLLSHDLLSNYKDTILQALNHKNPEIELQALGILELQGTLNSKADALLESLAKIVKKDKSVNMAELAKRKKELNGKVPRSVKQVGSFMGKGTASPASSVTPHEKDRKSVFVEPDSQDYVFIKTEVKFDVNRLTEHQKESLKRRRDDIPALYNDLSQSSSQDSQNLQEWFDKKNKHITEADKPSPLTGDTLDHDANKENKIIASMSETTDKLPNTDMQTKGSVPEGVEAESTHSSKASTGAEVEEATEQSRPAGEAHEHTERKVAQNATAKKLNFESRDEYPDDGEGTRAHSSPSFLDNVKRRQRRSMLLKVDSADPDNQTEPGSHTRVLRGKGKNTEAGKDELSVEDTNGQSVMNANAVRGLKRKASSDSEFEGQNGRRRRKLDEGAEVSRSSHSLPCKSTENDNELSTIDESVSQRTKLELSRLQINMVFDCSSQVRRRSRANEEAPKESTGKKVQSPEKEKPKPRVAEKEGKPRRSPSPVSRASRRLRSGRFGSRMEADEEGATAKDIAENKDKESNSESQETMEIEDVAMNGSEIESAKVDTATEKPPKDTTSNERCATPDPFSQDVTQSQDDGEEIVESSQDTDEFMKIGRYKDKQNSFKVSRIGEAPNNEKVGIKPSEPTEVGITDNNINKICNTASVTRTGMDGKKDEIVEPVPTTAESQVESSQEEDRRTNSDALRVSDTLASMKPPLLGFPSPKNNIKRFTRFKPQGRAAHMLGLVTKQSRLDSDSSIINIEGELQAIKSKCKDTRVKELDTEISTKRDRPSTPTSCSSRQEKIFNNMKSSDFSTPTPIKLFSNLKNDGEKVSPKFEKSMGSPERIVEEKQPDGNSSPSPEREQLQMLEWSSANPPSLTASPSASILKRNRQSMPEPDPDSGTPSKRKRVSFADPPVSKEMGYQIAEPSSPHKSNRLGGARSLTNRRDSPYRFKHAKPKFIEIESENHLLKANETSIEKDDALIQPEADTEIMTEVFTETENQDSLAEDMNVDTQPLSVDADDSVPATSHRKVTIDTLTLEIEITDTTAVCGNVTASLAEAKESCQKTQQDATGSPSNVTVADANKTDPLNDLLGICSVEIENVDKEKILDAEAKETTLSSSLESLPFNDSTIDNSAVKSQENLEDTVDANNLTGIDSSANSDEIFYSKPVRTSTQAVESAGEQDTLPVTDSLFGSLPMSQESQSASQSVVDIPRPDQLDAVNPIYPTLTSCTEPLKSIVGQLTYPLWVNHLSAYFSNRGLQSVGDLAQLTEREINRIPVKGKSKAGFVRSILQHYETSDMKQDSTVMQEKSDTSLADTKLIDDTTASSMAAGVVSQEMEITPSKSKETLSHSTPRMLASGSKSRNSLHAEPTNYEKSFEGYVEDKHTNTSTLSLPTQTEISMSDASLSGCQTKCCGFIKKIVQTKSAGTNTDPTSLVRSPPRKATKSVEAQMELSDLLDEIDLQLVLESAARRCTPEKFLAEYKNKMKHVPDSELEVETIRLLGLEIKQNYKDATLKAACRACGVTKVLSRLPDIFSNDSQFFSKVLSTYRKKLKTSDCINILEFAEVKNTVCQKCTPSELAEMLSQKFQEEEQAGIRTPLEELPSLNAILKRMPMDVVISHTVANDELIPSRLVLDIALENNDIDTIAEVLRRKPNAFSKKLFDKLWSPKLATEHVTTSGQSKDNLLSIFKAVSSQLSAEDLLNAYHEAMKQKL